MLNNIQQHPWLFDNYPNTIRSSNLYFSLFSSSFLEFSRFMDFFLFTPISSSTFLTQLVSDYQLFRNLNRSPLHEWIESKTQTTNEYVPQPVVRNPHTSNTQHVGMVSPLSNATHTRVKYSWCIHRTHGVCAQYWMFTNALSSLSEKKGKQVFRLKV